MPKQTDNPTSQPHPDRREVRELLDAFLLKGDNSLGSSLRSLDFDGFHVTVEGFANGEDGYLISLRQPLNDVTDGEVTFVDWQFHVSSAGELAQEVSRFPENAEAPDEVELSQAPRSWQQVHTAIAEAVRRDREFDPQPRQHRLPLATGTATVGMLIEATVQLNNELRAGAREASFEFLGLPDDSGIDAFGKRLLGEIATRDGVDEILAPKLRPSNERCSIEWSEACEELGLPITSFQNLDNPSVSSILLQNTPADLLEVLDGVLVDEIMKVHWRDQEWVVVALSRGLTNPPRIGETLRKDDLVLVSVVPAECILGLPDI